jgi:hypothetical protein
MLGLGYMALNSRLTAHVEMIMGFILRVFLETLIKYTKACQDDQRRGREVNPWRSEHVIGVPIS